MGTDIHMWIEKKQKDGSFKKLTRFVSSYYRPDDEYYGQAWFKSTDQPYNERNYDLFAIFANVRNGVGFAGCVTGSGFNIIAEPRGLPPDISEGVAVAIVKDGGVDHTPSWLMLDEILAFDWNQTTTHQGWVDGEEYKKFKELGHPESWCGGVSGGDIHHISNAQMEDRLNADEPSHNYYTQVQWTETYRECCSYFHEVFVPILLKRGKPNEIRLVFYFDS